MFQGTTIVAVKKGSKVALGGDGQVTFGQQHSSQTRSQESPPAL